MFMKLTPTEAGRLDTVLFNAVATTSRMGDEDTAAFIQEARDELFDTYPRFDPATWNFRTKDA